MRHRAELMKRMGASKAEVIAWWEQYWGNDNAYHPLLQLYTEEKLPKAIELVREKRGRGDTAPAVSAKTVNNQQNRLKKSRFCCIGHPGRGVPADMFG